MFNLSRPKAAMPSSYFWTWDHSCNWVLDDPGTWTDGCANKYLKRPETYIEDYRRLTDLAAGLGIKGIVIWGFLRDSHGGIKYAKEVANYAASKGVAILPGVGLTWYGGPYYEGEHKYNIGTFLRRNPQAKAVTGGNGGGQPLPGNVGVCPTHPVFIDWLTEGLQWLFREFSIGGVNMENGDFMICHCDRCNAQKASWPGDDIDFFRMQALAYLPAIAALKAHLRGKLITWATYTNWCFGCPNQYPDPKDPLLPMSEPRLTALADPDSIPQWTLSAIVRKQPLPLSAWLDDDAPKAALGDEFWPKGRKPCLPRNTGFMHQASQWWADGSVDRYRVAVSTFKEGCLRGWRSGLEGISIHGEVTSRCIPYALNYLAFSHFTHWPEDTLRQFGRQSLGQVLGGEKEGEQFVEYLAAWDGKALTDSQKSDIRAKAGALDADVGGHGQMEKLWQARFWRWLDRMARGLVETQNASFY